MAASVLCLRSEWQEDKDAMRGGAEKAATQRDEAFVRSISR